MENGTESLSTRTRKVRVTKKAEPKASATEAKQLPAKTASGTGRRKTTRHSVLVQEGPLQAMIATAAYYLAEQRNFTPGSELQDWLAAEQFIMGMHTG